MANQTIALQARAPQTDFMGRAIQQNAQMMNMLAQQRASQRQAAQTAQEMEIARAEEARKAELQPSALAESEAKALSARVKLVDEFLDLSIEGMKAARNADDAIKIGDFLKQSFRMPELQGVVDQTLSSLPQDPSQFEGWRQQTLFQSMDAKEQLARDFQRQTTGEEERLISMPKYAGAPGGMAATEVPGSRIQAAEGITYVRDANGNIYAMPKHQAGTGGFGPAPGAPSAPAGGDTFSRMIGVESGGQQFDRAGNPLTSRAGAIGIAQVMPGTAPEAARLAGLPFDENRYRNDAEYNLALGKAYYEKQLADFGDERLAAAAYNAGPGAVRRALQKGGPDGWINHVPRETQKYVRDVFGAAPAGRGAAGAPAPRGAAGAPQPVIKGQPKPAKTTEAERRFGTISQQMRTNLQDAVDILTNNPEAIQPSGLEYAASQIPFYGEEAALFMQSEARQQFDASVLRFLDNVTFVNTGAGTSKTQEANYRRSYIPTYQDTKGSAYRKLKSMVEFAKNVKNAAGVLWTPELDADFKALTAAVERLRPGEKTEEALPRVRTDADFDRLKPGTLFIDPNGEKRRKP